MAVPVALIAVGVSAALKIGSGIMQRRQAKKLAAQNVRPEFTGGEMYEDMIQMLTSEAQYGINPETRQFAEQQDANALTASLQTVLQAGGDPNAAANVYSRYTDSLNQLAAQDSNMRFQKVNALASAMDKSYNANKEDFLYNRDAPFKDTAQLAAAKQQAGYNEIMSGLDTALSGLINQQTSNLYGDKPGGGGGGNAGSAARNGGTSNPYTGGYETWGQGRK